MKQPNPIIRITAGTLSLLLALPSTLAMESTSSSQLIPGFVYTATTEEVSSGQIQYYTMEVTPDSTAYPMVLHSTGTIYGGGNINTALSTANTLGYHVMGALNSDYFTLGTGVPMGIVIENGLYKSSPSQFSSILFNGKETTILDGNTTVPITIENQRSGQELSLSHFNKVRSEVGGLYLLNRDFSDTTKTSSEGIMIRLYPTYEQLQSPEGSSLTVTSTMEFTVLEVVDSSYPLDIGEHDYILTAADASGYREMLEDFQVGDRITLETFTSNVYLQDAQWATGGGDIMISKGEITDSSYWQHNTGTAPRSAMGVKEDGTLLFYALDGRQTSSVGLTQAALAQQLLDEGCYYAVNLDGGGSTSMAVSSLTSPFTLSNASLVNSPSEGSLRSCGTFLFFADPREPNHLSLDANINNVLLGSHINLGRISVRDVNNTVLELYPTDSYMENEGNLGLVGSYVDSEGYAVYDYSPLEIGTESFSLYSEEWDMEGEVILEVLDYLTSLGIALGENGVPLESLSVKAEELVTFYPRGSVDGVEIYANGDSVQWSVRPVDENSTDYGSFLNTYGGAFQMGNDDCIISLEAGGLTAELLVEIETIFEDVPQDHWAYEAIDYLASNDIIGGYSPTVFGMGAEISRGDFVLMLYRSFNSPAVTSSAVELFEDVSDSDYAATAISWVVEQGIAAGMGDDLFGKDYPITREQAFLIIYRAFQATNRDLPVTSLSTLAQYQDQHEISSYSLLAAAALTQQGILEDSGTKLEPKSALSREAMAYYIYNMLVFEPQVQIAPTSLSLSAQDLSLSTGQKYSLLPLLEPAGSGTQLTWSSSDPSAVTVSDQGVVTNVFTGTGQPVVTITATTGDFTATCLVRCVPEGSEITLPSFKLPDLSNTDSSTDSSTDSNTDSSTDSNTDSSTDSNTDSSTDPNTDSSTDSNTDSNTDSDSTTEGEVPQASTLANTGIVVDAAGGLNVRNSPNSSGEVLLQIPQGTLVNLHAYLEDDWYQISCYLPTENGGFTTVQGYVMGAYIQEKNILATVTFEDEEQMLNLRDGAGTAFNIVARLPHGTQVVILQSFGEWYKVQVMLNNTLTTGFVSNSYLQY